MENENPSNVRSVERALQMLKVFTAERSEISLSEIGSELSLPKSTVFRLLRTLESQGFIEQNQQSGLYMLGTEALRIGTTVQMSQRIGIVAKPHMENLTEKTGETSNLYIRKGFNRICIMQVEGDNYVLRYSYVGQRLPLYCGASGHVLLAFCEKAFLQKYCANVKLERLTPNTIIDVEQLKYHLIQVNQLGYAYTLGQRDKLSASVAAPVYDQTGRVAAAVTISGPCAYYTQEFIRSSSRVLLDTADKISENLGYKPPMKNKFR